MYCRECGNQVSENAEICPNCGVRPLNSKKHCQACGQPTKEEQEMCVSCGSKLLQGKKISTDDNPSTLANLAACCFPIVGLVLYLVWKNDKPNSANSVCKWTIAGLVIGGVMYFLAIMLGAFSQAMMGY